MKPLEIKKNSQCRVQQVDLFLCVQGARCGVVNSLSLSVEKERQQPVTEAAPLPGDGAGDGVDGVVCLSKI